MRNPEDVRILVIGDIMLDHYIEGKVERISPEFPVPVVDVTKQYSTLGGCGNVVKNLRNLGVNVDCITSIGYDRDGSIIEEMLDELKVSKYIFRNSYKTTTKTRIISEERHIQMLRYDNEVTEDIDIPINDIYLDDDPPNYDIIIVSDYAKGMITPKLMEFLKRKNIKIIVDPKPKNINLYDNVFAITPNKKEMKQMAFDSNHNGIKYIINTLGEDGLTILEIENKNLKETYFKAKKVDVYNVSGAGDTLVAVLSTCVAMGYDIYASSIIANNCAGWTVTQAGTTAITKEMFDNIRGHVICQESRL